jgi:hypothetical protein
MSILDGDWQAMPPRVAPASEAGRDEVAAPAASGVMAGIFGRRP